MTDVKIKFKNLRYRPLNISSAEEFCFDGFRSMFCVVCYETRLWDIVSLL